ncbi:MAG: DinB family protein [Nitrospirae bacterium]|nr:DinB family protein [Nitrospirota bacterium]
MATAEGTELARTIRTNIEELEKICVNIDEETASRAPVGRWSPKQIISHIAGQDGIGYMPAFELILKQDTPRIDIIAEDPFYTERRTKLTMKELLAEAGKEYAKIAELLLTLSADQLDRKAHIPLFKDTALGEYPTLAMFIGGLGGWHLKFHIDHLNEVLKALGVS